MNHKIREERSETPNEPKLSDSGPEAPRESTAAQGEGAACASFADAVTEPDKPEAAPSQLDAKAAVRCSAWLGVCSHVS